MGEIIVRSYASGFVVVNVSINLSMNNSQYTLFASEITYYPQSTVVLPAINESGTINPEFV